MDDARWWLRGGQLLDDEGFSEPVLQKDDDEGINEL